MKARIIYKICLLTYKALKFGEPKYLYEYLVPFELETSVTVRHASDPTYLEVGYLEEFL